MNRIRNVAAALGLSATLGAAPLVMAGPTTVYAPPTPAEARDLQNNGEFEAAAAAWQEIAAAEPQNGLAWFNLGYCLHAAGHLEQAISIHQKAATFEDYEGIALYNLACAYSLVGDPDAAFEAMQESIAAGFDVVSRADADADFDNIRDDPRYAMLIHGGESASGEAGQQSAPRSGGMAPRGGAADMQQMMQFMGTRVQGIIEDMSPEIQSNVQELIGHAMMVGQQLMQEFQQRVQEDDQLMGAIMQVHEAIEGNPQLKMLIEQAHQWIESKMGDMGMGMGGGAPQAAPRQPVAVREAPAAGVAEAAAVEQAASAVTMAQANQLQTSGDYAAAAAAFAQLLRVNPENAAAAFGYAYNTHMSGNIDAAIEAHKRAAEFDQFRGISMYNLGCAYAIKGNAEGCVRALRASIEADFDVASRIGSDSDFDGIRDNAAFKAFVAEIGG